MELIMKGDNPFNQIFFNLVKANSLKIIIQRRQKTNE